MVTPTVSLPKPPQTGATRPWRGDIIAAAAAKIEQEFEDKEVKAQPVHQAGIEWWQQHFGEKAKPPPSALHEKIVKTCQCAGKTNVKDGHYLDNCSFHPTLMKETMFASRSIEQEWRRS